MTHNLDIYIFLVKVLTELIQISLLEGFHEEKLASNFSKLCGNKGVYKIKTIGKSDTGQRHGNEGEICFW